MQKRKKILNLKNSEISRFKKKFKNITLISYTILIILSYVIRKYGRLKKIRDPKSLQKSFLFQLPAPFSQKVNEMWTCRRPQLPFWYETINNNDELFASPSLPLHYFSKFE